jgi:carbon-monoxide dehydrogenase medium subunit
MKFPAFAYAAPATIDEALEALLSDDDARPLAGGQSLLPMMALRVAAPSLLVDLGAVAELRAIVALDDAVRIGAMVTHAENASSFDVWANVPLMSDALHHVAHQAVRNRGTFGGSLAHADAGAEMPLVVAALDGSLFIRGPGGERTVAACDFFQGHYTTAIQAGELLVAVDLPHSELNWAFEEMSRRAGDLAIAMAAVGTRIVDDICIEARIMLGGVSDRPRRAGDAEAMLAGRRLTDQRVREASLLAVAGIDVRSDTHATAELRRHIASVLVRRALTRLMRGE